MTESQYIPKLDRNAIGVLDTIVAAKKHEVERLRPARSELRDRLSDLPPTRPFAPALRGSDLRVIAEFKRRSPSAGWIRQDAEVAAVAHAYEAAGAAALSILTDQQFFGGSLADLVEGRKVSSLPILRKDFVVDEIQLLEARVSGADAVLLIARILDQMQLRALLAFAQEIGLAVLVETHDAGEVARAVEAGARIVGVNNRDLSTFRTDADLVLRVLPDLPAELLVVAESGVRDRAMVERYAAAGIDAVLIGESLMGAKDPGAALGAYTKVSRGEGVRG